LPPKAEDVNTSTIWNWYFTTMLRYLLGVRSSRGNEITFEAGAERQGGYCNGRARGKRL
jgi:hypothetical protein